MMNFRRTLLLAVAAAASAGAAGRAEAQCGYGGGYGFGAWDIGRLYGVLAQNVPYYAAFPPVYYSQPVARTYGYSPFAYPPGTMTPEVVTSEPLSIVNPFFSGASGEASTATPEDSTVDRTTMAPAARPAVIVNPYVERGAAALATR